MTLLGIQRRFSSIGEIRLGEKRERNGRSYPAKLETFRLTSKSLDAMKAVAERYGGSVERWEEGDGYQIITETKSLDIMLPPSGPTPYSLAFETWKAGGLVRRCDGETAMVAVGEQLVQKPCQCDPDNRECNPTMRLNVFLPEVAGFGTWKLSSTGYNAAAELPGMLDLLASLTASGKPIRATLRLEQRTSKRGGQTRHYAVPVIDLPYRLAELTGGSELSGNGQSAAPQLESTAPPREEPPQEPVAVDEATDSATQRDAPPAPAPGLQLDDPLPEEELERWRAGLHAAMRERMQPDQDEHTELRTLAQVVVGLGDRSLNDLMYREWIRLARALQGIAKIQANEAGGEPVAANSGSPSATEQVTVVSSPPGDSVTAAEAGITSSLGLTETVEPGERVMDRSEPPPATTPALPAPSVATPLSVEAFTVFAAAVLNIETTAGWELDELNTEELDHIVATMGIEDYDRWFSACSRELRAILRNHRMSPRQRADRAAALVKTPA